MGFTFTGEVQSSGKFSAPFRVSQLCAGTDAASVLLVGDEIVQVDGLQGLICVLLCICRC
jgi:hypothetical protein